MDNLSPEEQNKYNCYKGEQEKMHEIVRTDLTACKKTKRILGLKYLNISSKISGIQISVIIVSTIITFFETVKSKIEIDDYFLTVIPICLSTYIALILSITKFLKLEEKKEKINNIIEKFAFIINKLRHKRGTIRNFYINCCNLEQKIKEWDKMVIDYNNDGVDELITAVQVEVDTILNYSDKIHYQHHLMKLGFKDQILARNEWLFEKYKNNKDEIKLNHLEKKKYYCCCCCCEDDDYLYNQFIELMENKIDDKKIKIISDEDENNNV